MGLITETNQQYYAGSQGFRGNNANDQNQKFVTSFDTDLKMGSADSWNPTNADYVLNNFKVLTISSSKLEFNLNPFLNNFSLLAW